MVRVAVVLVVGLLFQLVSVCVGFSVSVDFRRTCLDTRVADFLQMSRFFAVSADVVPCGPVATSSPASASVAARPVVAAVAPISVVVVAVAAFEQCLKLC